AKPNRAVVLRSPSGFCQTRPSWWPSGWHDEQETQRRPLMGGSAVLNSTLPRTHSGVFGGSQVLTVASRLMLALWMLTAKSMALYTNTVSPSGLTRTARGFLPTRTGRPL